VSPMAVPAPSLPSPAALVAFRARVEETMAMGHRIPIRRLHGPCRPGGHAQPGPPRALPFSFCFSSFFLLCPRGNSPGPARFTHSAAQDLSRPDFRLKIVLNFPVFV
jgi:hypothetical protein